MRAVLMIGRGEPDVLVTADAPRPGYLEPVFRNAEGIPRR